MKKVLCLFLTFVFLASCVACATTGSGSKESALTNNGVIVDPEDERLSATDGIEAVNFDGEQYRVSVSSNQQYEIFSEDTTEAVDAAVYNRNLLIEEKYKIEIVPLISDYSQGQLAHEQFIQSSLSANDHDFDTVLMMAWRAGTLIVQGYFYDWYDDVPGINLEQPWWNQRCNDAFTISNKLYAAVGDISLTTLALAHGYLFNRRLAEDYQIGDLYQVVRDGNWTIDYVKQITQNIYTDVNQDGAYDNGDEYGFSGGLVNNLDAYLPSFGISLVTKDSDGELIISIDGNRNMLQGAHEKIMDLIYNSKGTYISRVYADRNRMFANGQVLMIDATVNTLINYCRDMTDTPGVLPYPKYNEEQTTYYSNAHDNFSVLCMAYNVENLEMVGKVTESLCCETYRTVITAYYDIALKTKYTDTDADEEMLDLIMAGRNYDLAVLFAPTLDRLYYFFRDQVAAESTSIISGLDSKYTSWETALDNLYGIFEELEANK